MTRTAKLKRAGRRLDQLRADEVERRQAEVRAQRAAARAKQREAEELAEEARRVERAAEAARIQNDLPVGVATNLATIRAIAKVAGIDPDQLLKVAQDAEDHGYQRAAVAFNQGRLATPNPYATRNPYWEARHPTDQPTERHET